MAEREETDKVVYGVALAVALLAGGLAVAATFAGEDEDLAPARAPRTEHRESRPEPGNVELVDPLPEPQGHRRGGPDFVPDLPEVPDLENEPPPERTATDDVDPRMEGLGIEMRFMSRARALIGEHPAEALGILEQHRRRHPHGVLREEREAFAIEALLSLEHPAEAERRYYDFLGRYPDSAFRGRLHEAMRRPPHEVGASGR